jgi:tRNA-specific 2-thiouridylase
VLTKSWNEYDCGRTPNPCALCNRFIKFGYLLEYARNMGADGIATGHYVRIFVREDRQVVLARGMDPDKDQSYFLSMVPAANLHHAYMPLGNLTKKEVRKIALDLGLPNAAKAESQDACIANIGDNLSETLRKLFDGRRLPGNFIDESGKILGRHDGIHNYTIGQRRGFKMGFGKPAFVKALNPENGDVTIAFDSENLMSSSLQVPNMNWLSEEHSKMQNFPVSVQIRYRHKAVPAEIENFSGNSSPVRIRFKDPQRAVTSGQIAVIYDGDRVIGGGEIA